MDDVFVEVATRLGLPGVMILAAVILLRPAVKVWAARETARTHAIETQNEALQAILGEQRRVRSVLEECTAKRK